jgi:hypothetical protein
LEYNHDFDAVWDEAMLDLLRAAAKLTIEMEGVAEVSDKVTTTDFLSFWTTSKERTSSSKSGRHFGHYKAACNDISLVCLHVDNMNLTASMGQPLT